MSTPILKKIHSLCLCLLFIQPIFALSNKSSHNLLIINSYNEQAAWSNSIIVPIMQEVGENVEHQCLCEPLALHSYQKRLPLPAFRKHVIPTL